MVVQRRGERGVGDLITIAAFVTPRVVPLFLPHFISLNRALNPLDTVPFPPPHPPPLGLSLSTREDNYVFQGNGSNSVPGTRQHRAQPKKGGRSSIYIYMEGASRPSVSLIFKGPRQLWANVEIE